MDLPGKNARAMLPLLEQCAEMDDEIHRLQALVIACRSSVKAELLHYEKMARAYDNLGPEGAQKHAVAEAEAQRLHDLMANIDALVMPNALYPDPASSEGSMKS